jgi:hypothetical protein
MKQISMPEELVDKLIEEFKQEITNLKTNQGKISFERNFKDIMPELEENIKKPIIYFSTDAWLKMNSLVQSSDKELAWQATVDKRKFKDREDTDDFFYYIDQVFVYPQEVTPTFVATDEVEYAEWSLKLSDEVFNKLRFQGHSHVNMATSPSGTDQNTYQNFLDQLEEDDFYIFMILNKRGEFTIFVYDFEQNIIFETKDCKVDVLTRTGSLNRWLEENKKQIKTKAPTYPTTPSWNNGDWYDRVYGLRYSSGTQIPQEQTVKNESEKKKKGRPKK